jgi:hypothetical protein
MFLSLCVRDPAPLIPDVALVELPPQNGDFHTCVCVHTCAIEDVCVHWHQEECGCVHGV